MKKSSFHTAIHTIDLSQPLKAFNDVERYTNVQILITLNGQLLDTVKITNFHKSISTTQLRQAIVNKLAYKLLIKNRLICTESGFADLLAEIIKHFKNSEKSHQSEILPTKIKASVIVATYDRPDDLRECLQSLKSQKSQRKVEIIVVDNNPISGLTPQVVAEFPKVVLINEPRKGCATARNTGLLASQGDILITTDDDVRFPPDWLEKLLAPFAQNHIMAVTGNVLPYELESKAQHMFEEYGGLGRGFERFEVNGEWFESFRFKAVPTWLLGGTANAAFRSSIFKHPDINLLNERLGPGMPSGVGEDTYLFYKVLKANFTIAYEPTAFVWHRHRCKMSTLRSQIYNYSKGHVAYHLTTLFNDNDLRAITRIAIELPKSHLWRIIQRFRGRSIYPISLTLIEILGNFIGPLALLKSYISVLLQGRSQTYISARKCSVFS